MIIAIGGIKGGTGKTTLAINLVIERVMKGRKVLLLDSGLGEMAVQFSEKRKDLGIPTNWDFMSLNKDLMLSELKPIFEKYDDVIIDIQLRFFELSDVLCLIDVLILPFQCCLYDVASLKRLKPALDSLKLLNKKMQIFGLLTCAKPRNKDNKKIMDIISEFLTCLPILYNRVAYDNATYKWLGVLEQKKKGSKCCNELNIICQIIFCENGLLQNLRRNEVKKYIYWIVISLFLVCSNIFEVGFSIVSFDFFSNYFYLPFVRSRTNFSGAGMRKYLTKLN